MEKKRFILDGHNMKNDDEFFDEIHRVLCPGFKYFGRNWDALNDVLRGGFGEFELGENIVIQFKYVNSIKKQIGENLLNKFERIVKKNGNIEIVYSNE